MNTTSRTPYQLYKYECSHVMCKLAKSAAFNLNLMFLEMRQCDGMQLCIVHCKHDVLTSHEQKNIEQISSYVRASHGVLSDSVVQKTGASLSQ